jgi:putative ABC transport system permease protein
MPPAVDTFRRNFLYSLRQMQRNPGFTAAVVVTFGLAIGATTTIFSFVHALLLRPFPFRSPEQLVEISSLRGGQEGKLSMREVLDIKEEVSCIESIAARTGSEGGYNFSGDGHPEEWKTVLTTGNLFEVLGVPLARGAKWADHSNRERDYRVILSYGVWRSKFGGTNVVGKSIALDHAPGYRIDGVAGRDFDYPTGIQVYRSLGGFTLYDRREQRNVIAVARIAHPFDVRRLQSELDALATRLATRFPASNSGLSFRARSMRSIYSGDVKPYLILLMGAVTFVLLIACGNVVNLFLSRGLSREREIAVRFSIGASRTDVLAQLLTEGLAHSLLSCCFGLILAFWWMHALRAQIGVEVPSWIVVDLNGRVLLVALAASVLVGLISAFAPALHVIRQSLMAALRAGSRTSSSDTTAGHLRTSMVVSEIALALVLLSGAGFSIRSFLALQSESKGFDADAISTFRVALGWKRYISQELEARYYEQLQAKLRNTPGIQDVAFVSSPPLSRLERNPNTAAAEGQPVDEVRRNPYVNHLSISENYFSVLHIALRAGRFFELFDTPRSELVAIVSDRLAKRLWPNDSPIGRRIRYDPLSNKPGQWRRVIGVVGSVQHDSLGGELSMDMYVPYRQDAAANQFILCKTRLSARDFQAAAEKAAWGIDPEQSIFDFSTYEKRISDSIWQLRLSRLLLVLFGIVALTLAAIGIYGVMSHLVSQRTREVGVRLALGATPAQVRSLIVTSAMGRGTIGIAIGVLGALALRKSLGSILKTGGDMDLLSVSISLSLLVLVMFLACGLPAWRASRIDPLQALREE